MKWAAIIVMLLGLVLGYALYPQGADAPESDTKEVNTPEASSGVKDVIDDVKSIGSRVEVYDGVSVPENTRTLDLSGEGYSGSLKAEVRHLTQLEVLDISNNNFTGLPAEVGQLSKLKVLNLANNPFTGLPYELGNLSNLETLDLRGTNYAKQDLDVIKQTLPASTQILVD